MELRIPALLAFVPPTSFEPGIPPMSGILRAKKKPSNVWDASALDVDPSQLGLDGSLTQVIRVYSPPTHGKGVIIEGEPRVAAMKLIEHLRREGNFQGG
jgi:electron transfer flavoprotein beta subunit